MTSRLIGITYIDGITRTIDLYRMSHEELKFLKEKIIDEIKRRG